MLLIGVVRKPHGLSGELSVEPLTDFPERFSPGLRVTWSLGEARRELTVASARPHGGRLLLTFEEAAGLEAARGLLGGDLSVDEARAHPAPEGYVYRNEIEGWPCRDRQGRLLGNVTDLGQTAAGPTLEIVKPDGKSALIPWVEGILVEIDRGRRQIVLDPPEGLLEL
jgi:16S rRNA processing protein RimM